MTRFELHDTKGEVRHIVCHLTLNELRLYLAEFKTHCAIEGSQYEFNHFVNWIAKNYRIPVEYEKFSSERVDM
jgi:hypothetical protein